MIEYEADVAPAIGEPLSRHWYVGEVPVAVTLNVAAFLAHVVTLAGWPVIDTAVPPTVSVAAEVVTLPQALVTTQSNDPASPATTEAMAYVAEVAPAMGVPPLRHWNVGVVPLADTVNDADVPEHVVTFAGCDVIVGAVPPTVSVAAELVTLPQVLVKTQV